MDIHIALDKDTSFDLQADSYDYTVCGDFNRLGNGFLEVSNLYPLDEQLKYESELLKLGICHEEKQEPFRYTGPYPYRFWSGKRNTTVWLCNRNDREEIDISSLSKICDIYRVVHVNVRLNTYEFKVGSYLKYKRLDVVDIYLAEK